MSISNSNDDDFIRVGLGGMGYSCRLYKKTIPNCGFIGGGCWQGKVDKKSSLPKVQLKNGTFFDMDTRK